MECNQHTLLLAVMLAAAGPPFPRLPLDPAGTGLLHLGQHLAHGTAPTAVNVRVEGPGRLLRTRQGAPGSKVYVVAGEGCHADLARQSAVDSQKEKKKKDNKQQKNSEAREEKDGGLSQ